jgi:hypothetical protein
MAHAPQACRVDIRVEVTGLIHYPFICPKTSAAFSPTPAP